MSELTLCLQDVLQLSCKVQKGLHSMLRASPGTSCVNMEEAGYNRPDKAENCKHEATKMDHEAFRKAKVLKPENATAQNQVVGQYHIGKRGACL